MKTINVRRQGSMGRFAKICFGIAPLFLSRKGSEQFGRRGSTRSLLIVFDGLQCPVIQGRDVGTGLAAGNKFRDHRLDSSVVATGGHAGISERRGALGLPSLRWAAGLADIRSRGSRSRPLAHSIGETAMR
jgi:hypothetical protein